VKNYLDTTLQIPLQPLPTSYILFGTKVAACVRPNLPGHGPKKQEFSTAAPAEQNPNPLEIFLVLQPLWIS
jgi:hypothetical protein